MSNLPTGVPDRLPHLLLNAWLLQTLECFASEERSYVPHRGSCSHTSVATCAQETKNPHSPRKGLDRVPRPAGGTPFAPPNRTSALDPRKHSCARAVPAYVRETYSQPERSCTRPRPRCALQTRPLAGWRPARACPGLGLRPSSRLGWRSSSFASRRPAVRRTAQETFWLSGDSNNFLAMYGPLLRAGSGQGFARRNPAACGARGEANYGHFPHGKLC